MHTRPSFKMLLVVLTVGLSLTIVLGFTSLAGASTEDAAIFYEELSRYGTWMEDPKHGPIWVPTQVSEGWRPYLNGRWTPSEQGYIFETEEPWGWATYHYGNWMPTDSHGWAWVPGRTWYPSTVNWRTNDDYVGWAPIPPQDFTPPSSYYPGGAYSSYPSGGYSSGGSMLDSLTAPFYMFLKASSFLNGFGMPYNPAYSYNNCGCLAPSSYTPVVYQQTVVVRQYVTPNYYPAQFMGGRPGAYVYGPPLDYVSRVTRIKSATINNYIRQVNIYQVHNAVPPRRLMEQRPYLKQIVPPGLESGKPLPPVKPVQTYQASGLLNRDLVPAVQNLPAAPAVLPKVTTAKLEPGKGMVGVALPPKAVHQLDQKMTSQIQKLPPAQRMAPAPPLVTQVSTGQPPTAGPPAATPGVPKPPAEVKAKPGVVPTGPSEKRPAPPQAAGDRPRSAAERKPTPGVAPSTPPGKPESGDAAEHLRRQQADKRRQQELQQQQQSQELQRRRQEAFRQQQTQPERQGQPGEQTRRQQELMQQRQMEMRRQQEQAKRQQEIQRQQQERQAPPPGQVEQMQRQQEMQQRQGQMQQQQRLEQQRRQQEMMQQQQRQMQVQQRQQQQAPPPRVQPPPPQAPPQPQPQPKPQPQQQQQQKKRLPHEQPQS